MKGETSGQARDDRLERLIDEELRAAAQPPAVDLRAKVLAALDASPSSSSAPVEPGFRWILQPRWALALAAAAVVVLAVLVGSRDHSRQMPAATAARQPLASRSLAAREAMAPSISGPPAWTTAARSARGSERYVAWPVGSADSVTPPPQPYLPGAPAGDLGDPVEPMPSPPPIAFAPIATAPPVSETARPVTDFPADNKAAAPTGADNSSGGTRR